MALQAGLRLGPYEIVAPIGAGGMGEVYRARDERLGRDVAVKVLLGDFSANADRLRRFEQEARAASALNDPHILAVYDVGSHEGTPYLVTELLEGQSLRDRLREGPLPVRKALEIAAQAARGLAAAHEKGIVHRDLKPENLFLTRDGRLKILDFGLAKLTQNEDSQSLLAAAPTRLPSTEAGAILGTVGYMSPEQVRAQPADARSDLFALGAILYEMLSGRRAFERGSSADTLSAILRDDPPELESSGRHIPPAAERIVRHLLEKNPEERFRSAYDLAFDLEALSGSTLGSTAGPGVAFEPRVRAPRWLWPGIAAATLAIGLVVGSNLHRDASTTAPVRYRLTPLTDRSGAEQFPALSPDGDVFLFERADGGDLDVFAQRVGGQNPTNLTADCDQDDHSPAFSPDGRSIAYRSACGGSGIFVMGATGESPRRVADFGFDPSFSPDGREIVVSTQRGQFPTGRGDFGELWAVRIETGEKRLVTRHDAVKPSWSPGGQRIAFWGLKNDTAQRDLWTAAADGSEAESEPLPLVDDPAIDWYPVWAGDGRAIYFLSDRDGTMALYRLAVDEKTGRPSGAPEPAAAAPSAFVAGFSLARDGRIAMAAQGSTYTVWRAALDVDQGKISGDPSVVYRGSRLIFDAVISPDGGQLALTLSGAREDLYSIRTDGSGLRQLTDDPHRQRALAWLVDGSRIVFASDRNGHYDLWTVSGEGGALALLATSGERGVLDPTPSPDPRRMAMGDESGTNWIADLGATPEQNVVHEIAPFTGDGIFVPASWSPDGSQIVGASGLSGKGFGSVFSYEIETRTYHRLSDEARWPDFVDARHVIWQAPRGIELADLTTGVKSLVLTQPRPGAYRMPSVSKDGKWLAWVDADIESDIWLATAESVATR